MQTPGTGKRLLLAVGLSEGLSIYKDNQTHWKPGRDGRLHKENMSPVLCKVIG